MIGIPEMMQARVTCPSLEPSSPLTRIPEKAKHIMALKGAYKGSMSSIVHTWASMRSPYPYFAYVGGCQNYGPFLRP